MTIDGKGSLHAMGVVSATTSHHSIDLKELKPVKRQKRKKASEVICGKGIPITDYITPAESGLSKVTFAPLMHLQVPFILPLDVNLDLLWHSAYFFNKGQRVNWSGYMSATSAGEYPGKAIVTFLPILDLNPSDSTCIYSVLNFISSQANTLGIQTPILTFDQPLWLRAMEIVRAKSLPIVLILGGFHLMMSYLGRIGGIMKGSGLTDALNLIYGTNAVEHMISGKAVSRALRGHFLVESPLTTKLMRMLVKEDDNDIDEDTMPSSSDVNVSDQETSDEGEGKEEGEDDMVEIEEFYKVDIVKLKNLAEAIKDVPGKIEKVEESQELRLLHHNLEKLKDELSERSRTARYWIQYLHYIQVLKWYIRAERTGNWSLHLEALGRMLNIFAASGHINYAKCARLHLQDMLQLPLQYPWVYKMFYQEGYHTVRRTDRYWAGLWSDLIIEQCLMRSLKTQGGITRGGGVTESVRMVWLSSTHRVASVRNAMGTLTGQHHGTNEQHIDLANSRVLRDNKDLLALIDWFDAHEPFNANVSALRSLSSGLTATEDDNVNCDDVEEVGRKIQKKLDNVCIEDATIKRSDQVKTLISLQPGIKMDDKTVNIDPLILFARLTALLQRDDEITDKFRYELTPEPTSLFKDGMMRKANKSVLRNFFLDKNEPVDDVQADTCIIDGGALLHKIQWQAKGTFKDVINKYINFLKRRYDTYDTVCIVFDGYVDKNSIKAQEHLRR